MTKTKTTWQPIAATPNYLSHDGKHIAVYHDSYKGYGNYWVFPVSLPVTKRLLKNAITVGGLPDYIMTA